MPLNDYEKTSIIFRASGRFAARKAKFKGLVDYTISPIFINSANGNTDNILNYGPINNDNCFLFTDQDTSPNEPYFSLSLFIFILLQ